MSKPSVVMGEGMIAPVPSPVNPFVVPPPTQPSGKPLSSFYQRWRAGGIPKKETMTMRRRRLLQCVFDDTARFEKHEDFEFFKGIVSRISMDEGTLKYNHSQENIDRMVGYMKNLNMSIEDIDVLLGDESDYNWY